MKKLLLYSLIVVGVFGISTFVIFTYVSKKSNSNKGFLKIYTNGCYFIQLVNRNNKLSGEWIAGITTSFTKIHTTNVSFSGIQKGTHLVISIKRPLMNKISFAGKLSNGKLYLSIPQGNELKTTIFYPATTKQYNMCIDRLREKLKSYHHYHF